MCAPVLEMIFGSSTSSCSLGVEIEVSAFGSIGSGLVDVLTETEIVCFLLLAYFLESFSEEGSDFIHCSG